MNKKGGRARYALYFIKKNNNKEAGRARYSCDLCLSNFKETRLRGWRHHAIRKHCHTNIMTWVQATRTHIKTWAWGLAHVTPAVRRQTQMSPGVCCPASPLTSLRPMRVPVSKTQGWDAEEEDLKLASGLLTRVCVYIRMAGVRVLNHGSSFWISSPPRFTIPRSWKQMTSCYFSEF